MNKGTKQFVEVTVAAIFFLSLLGLVASIARGNLTAVALFCAVLVGIALSIR